MTGDRGDEGGRDGRTLELGLNSKINVKKLNMEDLPSSFRGLKAIVVDGKLVRAAVTGYYLTRLGIQAKVANHIKKAVSLCEKNGSLTSGLFQPDIIFVEKDSWFSREHGIFNIWQLDWKQNGYMLKIPRMILLATNISNAEFNKFSYLSCLEFLYLRIIYYFDKFVNLLSDI
ncbi:histidine kinase 4-like [Arachis duranensis]|uniref:Histidine kinase 4-like n=1 Tax=Arachis duranensis TaxID=130453 RepID=A0A6P4B4M5_ARADU|nr:histidine kinase 4-like [Arachis duranensis]